MNYPESFLPKWVSAPGQTINDILVEKGITKTEFAYKIDQNTEYVENLIAGKEEITLHTAKQLHSVLGSSISFWINRENLYRNQISINSSLEIDSWINSLPIKDMLKLGWIKKSTDYYNECLKFFDVKDISTWNKDYLSLLESSRFRTSQSFNPKLGSLISWLRYGEIQSALIKCDQWNPDLLYERLNEIKELTRIKSPINFLPTLSKICSDCGIAMVISPTPTGCPASGAAKFLDNKKAMILLSFRYLSEDQFWFTFFHETGHLLLNHSKRVFLEENIKNSDNEEEIEANIFAGEVLIPTPLRAQLKTLKRDKHSIARFAMKAGVSAGIVIGQMQHEGIIPPSYLNGYKRRYNWEEIMYSINTIQ